jgi:hypothetical protein
VAADSVIPGATQIRADTFQQRVALWIARAPIGNLACKTQERRVAENVNRSVILRGGASQVGVQLPGHPAPREAYELAGAVNTLPDEVALTTRGETERPYALRRGHARWPEVPTLVHMRTMLPVRYGYALLLVVDDELCSEAADAAASCAAEMGALGYTVEQARAAQGPVVGVVTDGPLTDAAYWQLVAAVRRACALLPDHRAVLCHRRDENTLCTPVR